MLRPRAAALTQARLSTRVFTRDARIPANELTKGALVASSAVPGQRPNGVLGVVELNHIKPGKGVAYVQAKMRCVRDGSMVPHKFRSSDNVEIAEVDEIQTCTILYFEDETVHLMDAKTFEQSEVPLSVFGDQSPWLQEGMEVSMSTYNGEPLKVILPQRAAYVVASAQPGGRESTDTSKPATLTNGVNMRVPHFVEAGDTIVVVLEDGTYGGKFTADNED